ncbi:transglycosylase domain-containing protein, partial [uncultured Gemmiger sp.]|uniref:transglycosylase domain-containing protein n=1 Tax=uncultured Gemmiger sp. TaxID=1623490 RepID=UPI0025CC32A5
MILRFLGCLICVCIMLGSVGAVVLAMYVVQVTADPEGKLDLEKKKDQQTTILYTREGDEYATLSGDANSIWVSLSDIPENLQHAVVAIEDKNFYDSIGVNFKRTIAAALNELTGQQLLGSQQGASTLEQQLVKNLTDDDKVDYMRKVREIFRAIGLANRYSKETILEAYLNTVPLTGTIEGVEAGANTYFGKSVGELSLSECAVLASISKNPTGYNPFTNPENLIQRRNHVLYEMLNQGYISQADYDSATAETITLAESKSKTENVAVSSNNSYFTEAVITQLTKDLKEAYNLESDAEAQDMIFNGGLRVYTTVDPDVQNSVEQLMLNNTWNNDELFYALWHEEEIRSDIPVGAEIRYDANGLPMKTTDETVSTIFAEDDIPVYTDKTNQTFKTGTYKDDNGNQFLTFYEEVRTQAAIAVTSTEEGHKGEVIAVGGGLGEK